MKNHAPCSYAGDRDRAIVDYLYGECDPGERTAFESHLDACAACSADVGSLRGVRQVLAGWAPPEPIRALDHGRAGTVVQANDVAAARGPRLATVTSSPPVGSAAAAQSRAPLAALPAWARVAAAVLCVGVGAGAANLRINYSPDGVTVRTGWLDAPSAAVVTSPSTAPTALASDRAPSAPWQADLVALEARMRTEMRDRTTPAPEVATASIGHADQATHDADLLRQVRTLIQRSEQRQETEMAMRVKTLMNDVQAQRQADMLRINRTIGTVQNNTGMEVLRQGQMLRSLAVQVSQR